MIGDLEPSFADCMEAYSRRHGRGPYHRKNRCYEKRLARLARGRRPFLDVVFGTRRDANLDRPERLVDWNVVGPITCILLAGVLFAVCAWLEWG